MIDEIIELFFIYKYIISIRFKYFSLILIIIWIYLFKLINLFRQKNCILIIFKILFITYKEIYQNNHKTIEHYFLNCILILPQNLRFFFIFVYIELTIIFIFYNINIISKNQWLIYDLTVKIQSLILSYFNMKLLFSMSVANHQPFWFKLLNKFYYD